MGGQLQCFAPVALTICGNRTVQEGHRTGAEDLALRREQQMRNALRCFSEAGHAALESKASSRCQQAWVHAYNLVEAILLGAQRHLPEVLVSTHFVTGQDCKRRCPGFKSAAGAVAAVIVRFSEREMIGEFATRSRIGSSIRLAQEVAFALLQPEDASPLRLAVYGLDFPSLEESRDIRQRLRGLLGEGYNSKNAFKWWLQNRDREYPLDKSKMRRIHASSFEGPPMVRPPDFAAEAALWGYLNAPSNVPESFDFYDEGKDGIRVTARILPASSDEEEETRVLSDEVQTDAMKPHQRTWAEPLLPSAINMSALTHGRAGGGPGAEPAKIAKLFSAASTWGPGHKGWQSADGTWLCTDTKDAVGRVVKEQGRVIWITPGESEIPRTPGDRVSCRCATAGVTKPSSKSRRSAVSYLLKETWPSLLPLLLMVLAMLAILGRGTSTAISSACALPLIWSILRCWSALAFPM
mmetsp:Transcript_14472/g.25462  ORF Transcript_14472/g.25462 Transcript_14472/m.25462 type:complete len:467 (+) Transcript_14472:70-1470(+)|eukprot:CAMPEP_0197626064 /NCGR_PEP_ID=MMETSP1338-20131121/5209_1 /TAXON_ID=43686 ORGANISM="Pelagodinium beii, Strain RCC1491" /NCGR_SAMPLE_ID=MMETSP1338 /ASSEMBLY_ACC=CAM_ASM_000754 /LENGTH=466 /DNA_ID=CAMNT_0043196581 /DNA_START=68 /DNA_END=1468 /DNA_ORIENTATION=+